MLSKRSQSQKFTYSVIPLKRNIRKDTVIESWLVISWGERDGRAGGWQLKEHHVSFWNSQWRWKCSTTDYGKGFKLCESLFMYWNEFHGPWLCVSLVAQPHLTLCYPMDCSLPVSSVCGIVQARILEWVALPFLLQGLFLTQGSNPGVPHWTQVSHIAGGFFTEPPGKPYGIRLSQASFSPLIIYSTNTQAVVSGTVLSMNCLWLVHEELCLHQNMRL